MPLDPQLYGTFLVVALASVLSPGPDTLLVIRAALSGGNGQGFAALVGVQIGLLGHLAAAVFGLSLLLLAAPLALKGVALAGALYLCWLGYRNIRAATGRNMTGASAISPAAIADSGAGAVCRDAILTNLLNPKVILLFIAVMPGFVEPGPAAIPVQLAFLGASIILLNIIWQSALVLAASRARRWLTQPRVQRGIALISGLVFIAFAALLVAEFVAAPG
ncbi:MAG: LysE family translocator [Proteobacteria bacterium]|nr:LysE family translocator [Pseudomonadota bacterium]MDA1357946.1 LysE family translocator [Pseudomonadota bacterium]